MLRRCARERCLWISPESQVIPVILNRCSNKASVFRCQKVCAYGAHVAWEDRGKAGERRENRSQEGKNGSAPGFNQWFRRQPGVSVKKCSSCSCNDGNSDCHSLRGSAFIECILCLFLYFLPMHVAYLLLRLLSVVLIAHARRFIVHNLFRFLFLSFKRRRCGAAASQVILAPNVTLVAHSSMMRSTMEKKLRVWHRVIDRIKTSIYVCKKEAAHICPIVSRDERQA